MIKKQKDNNRVGRESMRIILFAFLIFSNICYGFDFKGLELGKRFNESELPSKNIGASCFINKSRTLCNGLTKIAGHDGDIFIATNAAQNIDAISIQFKTEYYDDILAALIEKFGKPTSTSNSKVHNSFGATFDQIVTTWKNDTGDFIRLERYGSTVIEGSVSFISKSYSDYSEGEMKKNRSDL